MKNFLRKLYIWQNIYLKNKYLFRKKSYSLFGEDMEIKKNFKLIWSNKFSVIFKKSIS